MVYVRLEAKLSTAVLSLIDFVSAAWLWEALGRAFPYALAAVLMPDHLHVVSPADDCESALRLLRGVLSNFGRGGRRAVAGHWAVVEANLIVDGLHLRRAVRYAALNPCRAGLARDPLEWLWSTHRDVVGAVDSPWVSADRLAAALGRSPQRFVELHHRYVSGDPSVHPAGTAAPLPAALAERFREAARPALSTVLAASASATRTLPRAVLRKGRPRQLFLSLANQCGWQDVELLAKVCDTTGRSVRRTLARAEDCDLRAAALCIGDARLRLLVEQLPSQQWPGSP